MMIVAEMPKAVPRIIYFTIGERSSCNFRIGCLEGSLWGRKIGHTAVSLALNYSDIRKDPKVFRDWAEKENQSHSSQIIAVTSYDRDFVLMRKALKILQEAFHRAFFIMGGAIVNGHAFDEIVPFFPRVNVYVKGDGEKVFPDIIKLMRDKTTQSPFDRSTREGFSRLRGIHVTHQDFIFSNPEPNLLSQEELNNRELYPIFIGGFNFWIKGSEFLSLHTSRGCEFNCIFCSHQYRFETIGWEPEGIIEILGKRKRDVEKGKMNPKVKAIGFTDDNFFYDRERALSFLTQVVNDASLRSFFGFVFQGRVDSFFLDGKVDRELLQLLARIKTRRLMVGSDGFSEDSLRYFQKGYSFGDVETLVGALDEVGIRQLHYAILTHPDISLENFQKTIRNIVRLSAKHNTFAVRTNVGLVSVSGTPLFNKLRNEGYKFTKIVEDKGGHRFYLPELILPRDEKVRREVELIKRCKLKIEELVD